jgi:RimJ/RimL family protein N-acetyltransferase
MTTRRLLVRPLSLADYADFAALEQDPNVKKFSGGRAAVSEDRFAQLITQDAEACLAVCAKEDGRFVGRCGFRLVDDRIELEVFLARAEQKHGFGSELFEEMLSHCRRRYPSAKIAATVSPANSRATKLLDSHQFTDTGETVLTKAGFQSLYVRTV